MGDKLVMGYWDCPYCDTKGIKGTERDCPACGHPRGTETQFYMKEVSYLSEEEAKTKGQGEDWFCPMCDTLNSSLDTICKSCGSPRTAENKSYTQMKEERMKQNQPVRSAPPKKKFNFKPLIIIGLVLALIIWACMPKVKGFTVENKNWESSIDVEQYKEVEESDWKMPDDARYIREASEVHHYDKVSRGYETETYQEKEKVGSHTETYYTDNGDGSFSEHTKEVPDYEYVTKTRQVEKFDNVPVYKTKYYYYVWKWVVIDTKVVTDSTNEVYYADVEKAEDIRSGSTRVKYTATLKNKKGKSKVYKVSESIWKKLEVGGKFKLKVDGDEILSIEK